MVDFQTYQKTTSLINNKKSRAVDADHKHFLLESQLSVWVKGHFILLAPNYPQTYHACLYGQYLLFLQEKENLSIK